MPNHVTTILTINGPYEDIKRFVDAVNTKAKNHEGQTFDFNGVFPMPESLNITAGGSIPDAMFALGADHPHGNPLEFTWVKEKGIRSREEFKVFMEKENPDALAEGHKAIENLRLYGVTDWYGWKNKNWGTKWGAYDEGEWEINGDTATIAYQTAWSPATPFYMKVSQKFPTLAFTHKYSDEGGGFVGWETIENGEITANEDPEWNSAAAIEILKELGTCVDDED